MDPNANLKEQREIVARLQDDDSYVDHADLSATAERLAQLVQALDEWLTQGGVAPLIWRYPGWQD